MHLRVCCLPICLALSLVAAAAIAQEGKKLETKQLKIGIIGLDTSHVMAFTKEFNNPEVKEDLAGFKVVAAYPRGSADIESSASRIPKITEDVKAAGLEVVNSLEELVKRVDCVLLETNDGRPHLEQALVCFKAGKPTFIDKPVAASLADAVAIYQAAKKFNVPVFSSSSLRFAKGAQEIRGGAIGDVLGCDAYSPCSLEKTHPELFWYGIHGVETLFTVMGSGCESVTRVSTSDFDLAAGVWSGGRIGTFRGIRGKGGSGYGGTAFGSKGIREIGKFDGYRPLAVEIAKFFRGGPAPVSPTETLQIYAFMEAADESKRQGGKPVTIESVMKRAESEAAARLASLGVK